ncbi:MAG: tetratricopeptide repeat protein [Planctomycetia bacterium]|nr:tetratricopeptide repeat protein [Planctomycetia bacterium]
MADNDPTVLPPVSPEHRHICAANFERANQVIASGNYDYGIQLLLTCCKLDPANIIYRQTLRRTEKTKYKNNLRGSAFSILTASAAKARIKAVKRSRNYVKVLEHGEEVLAKNPWDIGAQMDMADAADALGLLDLAIWILQQAREKDPNHAALNRSLARLFEKRGNFTQAINLWELVHKVDPSDIEAHHKAKDLAASETILRGQYDQVTATPRETAADEAPARRPGPAAASPAERQAQEAARLEARIKSDPTRASGYLDLANFHRRHNDLTKAREILMQGLGPTGQHFQLNLDLAEIELEPFRQNLAIAEDKLKADPQNEEVRKIRLGLRREINTREMDIYRMKADRFPTELVHRLELGVRLMRVGQIDEAIKELQAARSDARISWRALLYLGHCFKFRNNWKLARRNFEDALHALPPNEQDSRKEILFVLAQGCAEAGELNDAIEMGHELANLDYSYRDIGRLLEEWQSRLQQA